MSHPEAPTLCWCFDLDILNHNMVNTSDTIMITCKYWPAENRFPPWAAQNCQLQHYCATFCTPVFPELYIYKSHNIDLIASLKIIGTFDPQPIQSLALRLSRPSPQPLWFIIRPAFDAMSRCHKHGRLWRNRQLICRRPSSKWGPQTHP